MIKRFVKNGKVINSTTETLAPKVVTDAAEETPEKEQELEETEEDATRTCNSCIQGKYILSWLQSRSNVNSLQNFQKTVSLPALSAPIMTSACHVTLAWSTAIIQNMPLLLPLRTCIWSHSRKLFLLQDAMQDTMPSAMVAIR